MVRTLKALVIASVMVIAWGNGVKAQVPVIWDGSAGDGRWESGNWTKDGISGQTAVATMGDATGGRGGVAIMIGGGAVVEHDHNRPETVPGALGDFKPRMDLNGPASLTIKEGAVLWMDSHSDSDGRWTRVGMDINLDGGTLRRTHSAPSESGGKLIFGYHNELLPNQRIEINATNGGRIESHGKMVFGEPGLFGDPGHNTGIEVAMTINDGTIDLTGGGAWPDYFGQADGELVFTYEYEEGVGPKNEEYSINFTGPGSITVDPHFDAGFNAYKGGIYVAVQDSGGIWGPLAGPDLFTPISYEDLWDLGILQANGESGQTGAEFSTYFTVTGTQFTPDYTLTSLLAPAGVAGDYNNNGIVDAADYTLWRDGKPLNNEVADAGIHSEDDYTEWKARFGDALGGGSISVANGAAVPEPARLMLAVVALAGLRVCRRRGCAID